MQQPGVSVVGVGTAPSMTASRVARFRSSSLGTASAAASKVGCAAARQMQLRGFGTLDQAA